jgi:hypothetical protein
MGFFAFPPTHFHIPLRVSIATESSGEVVPEPLHFLHKAEQISLMAEYMPATEVVLKKSCRVA